MRTMVIAKPIRAAIINRLELGWKLDWLENLLTFLCRI